jgi:hypothetical protein
MKSFVSKMFITSMALSTLIGAQAAYAQKQTEPDWYRARAIQEGVPAAQVVDEGTSGETGCRYLYSGGPKNSFITC